MPGASIKIHRDGREVCNRHSAQGRAVYRDRTEQMWRRQGKLCCLCSLPLSKQEATFEHQDGRGMGGSTRDDRIWKDGKPYNGAAHGLCNALKGSRRITYNPLPRKELT